MRRQAVLLLFLLGFGACAAKAQAPFPLDTQKFAQNASNVSTVSLDKNMLQLAKSFMGGAAGKENSKNQAAAQIINHLDGIYVRDYEYSGPGKYSKADVEALRKQLESKGWTSIVTERGKNEDSDIYVHQKNGETEGMFILSAEPNELSFVQILGSIRPEDLRSLSGQFGVPPVGGPVGGVKSGVKGGAQGGVKKGSHE